MSKIEDNILSLQQAAKELGRSDSHVHALLRAGKIKSFRPARDHLFLRKEIERIKRRNIKPTRQDYLIK